MHVCPSGCYEDAIGMSALPPKADMCGATSDVRFGPEADIGKLPNWKPHLAVVSPKSVQMCVSRVGKTVARITSSPYFLGLPKEAIGYPHLNHNSIAS